MTNKQIPDPTGSTEPVDPNIDLDQAAERVDIALTLAEQMSVVHTPAALGPQSPTVIEITELILEEAAEMDRVKDRNDRLGKLTEMMNQMIPVFLKMANPSGEPINPIELVPCPPLAPHVRIPRCDEFREWATANSQQTPHGSPCVECTIKDCEEFKGRDDSDDLLDNVVTMDSAAQMDALYLRRLVRNPDRIDAAYQQPGMMSVIERLISILGDYNTNA